MVDGLVSFTGTHGAGLYGRTPRRTTTCSNGNNPAGHNPACPRCAPTRLDQWKAKLAAGHRLAPPPIPEKEA